MSLPHHSKSWGGGTTPSQTETELVAGDRTLLEGSAWAFLLHRRLPSGAERRGVSLVKDTVMNEPMAQANEEHDEG